MKLVKIVIFFYIEHRPASSLVEKKWWLVLWLDIETEIKDQPMKIAKEVNFFLVFKQTILEKLTFLANEYLSTSV